MFIVSFTPHVFIGCCFRISPEQGAGSTNLGPAFMEQEGPVPAGAGSVWEGFLCFKTDRKVKLEPENVSGRVSTGYSMQRNSMHRSSAVLGMDFRELKSGGGSFLVARWEVWLDVSGRQPLQDLDSQAVEF